MKFSPLNLICILFLSTIFISCSNSVSSDQDDLANKQIEPSEVQSIIDPGDGGPVHGWPIYIKGPSTLEEKEAGTYTLTLSNAHDITWYYRDTVNYNFLEGGTGSDFGIYFYLRDGNEYTQTSQIKVTYTQNGTTKSDIIDITVVPASEDSEYDLPLPDRHHGGLPECNDDHSNEPCYDT